MSTLTHSVLSIVMEQLQLHSDGSEEAFTSLIRLSTADQYLYRYADDLMHAMFVQRVEISNAVVEKIYSLYDAHKTNASELDALIHGYVFKPCQLTNNVNCPNVEITMKTFIRTHLLVYVDINGEMQMVTSIPKRNRIVRAEPFRTTVDTQRLWDMLTFFVEKKFSLHCIIKRDAAFLTESQEATITESMNRTL